jgi:hypothetical protein
LHRQILQHVGATSIIGECDLFGFNHCSKWCYSEIVHRKSISLVLSDKTNRHFFSSECEKSFSTRLSACGRVLLHASAYIIN